MYTFIWFFLFVFIFPYLQGADPNSENGDGIPVLTIAVLNKHFESLPALIYGGADVNKKVGQ